jgi:hypothetical protein
MTEGQIKLSEIPSLKEEDPESLWGEAIRGLGQLLRKALKN